MALLANLICHTCKEQTCLGKWLRHEPDVGFGFWRGQTEYGELGLKALNFLARHVNHELEVLTADRFDEFDRSEYRDVENELRSNWPADAEQE